MCLNWLAVSFQVKREELLQFAQGAIAGLKINAELLRWLKTLYIPISACLILQQLLIVGV